MRTPGRRRAWAGFTWILRAPRRWRLSLIGRWPSCTIFGTCALERFTQVAKNDPHETALLYGLSIQGAIPEGTKGFEQQEQAAKLFETSMPTNRTIRVCCTTSFTPTMIPSTHSRV